MMGILNSVEISPDRITEIYPVAPLKDPNHMARIVLAAAESLFAQSEPDQNRRRPDQFAAASAMSILNGSHAKPAVPLLMTKLKSDRTDVRITALGALASIGPSAKDAVTAIRALESDKSKEVQRAAQVAIKVIEGR